jgi:hypothetical protein
VNIAVIEPEWLNNFNQIQIKTDLGEKMTRADD